VHSTAVLHSIPTLRRLRVWTEYYARWTPQLAREDEVVHRQWQLQKYVTQLHSKVQQLSETNGAATEPIAVAVAVAQ